MQSRISLIIILVIIVIIVLLVISHQDRRNATHNPKPRKGKKSKASKSWKAIKAEAVCPAPEGITTATVDLDNPCFTFTCDQEFNISSISIDKTVIEPTETLTLPLDDLPLLTPDSDTKCPDDPATYSDDPLISSVIKKDVVFQKDWLIFTNKDSNATAPEGPGTSGPWYFEKEIGTGSGLTVITCGCRETYDNTNVNFTDIKPPHEPSTSKMEVTFDASLLDPNTTKVQLDLKFGWSSELNYDFFTIYVNGVAQFRYSGQGPSASDPYGHDQKTIIVPIDATLAFEYLRDPAARGGVDSVYFTITKATPLKQPAFPAALTLFRQPGDLVIKDFTTLTELDGNATKIVVDCDLQILEGDQLCLTADPATYSSYVVTATFQDVPQIYDHRYEEKFIAPIDMNLIEYNNRRPKTLSLIGGWYNTNDSFARTQVFIQEVSGCTDGGPNRLLVEWYSAASSGGYYMNNYWGGGDGGTRVAQQTFIEVGKNIYQEDNSTGKFWVFDPITGIFQRDISTSANLDTGNWSIMLPIRNADERYWENQLRLADPDAEFNTPWNFFDYAINYYKCGKLSSLFGQSSYDPYDGALNFLDLDLTKVKASYGVGTKAQYDDIARRLLNNGILRKYGIQRWIYAADPDSNIPVEVKRQLSWVVGQNRPGYLGFTTIVKNEGEENWPRLMPGETICLKGTGTRLDNFPLRLAMDGYRTGPKAPAEFTHTYSGLDPRNGKKIPRHREFDMQKEWAYYTLRLPITIDSTNDTIYSRSGGYLNNADNTQGYIKMTVTSTPPATLGPYFLSPFLTGQGIPVSGLSGQLVAADPLNAATFGTNILNTFITDPGAFNLEDITSLNVDSTAGFANSGSISIETDTGFVDATYTSKTATSFDGLVGVGAVGQFYFVSIIVNLPQSTIQLNDTSGLPASGKLLIYGFEHGGQIITYTGKTATTITGVTGGSGRINTGDPGLSFDNYDGFFAPLNNAAALNGKIALVRRGLIALGQKVWMAAMAGAIGAVLYNNTGGDYLDPFFDLGQDIPIPASWMSQNDGDALQVALASGKKITVNITLESPIFKTVLPHGTWYLTDLLQQLFDDYVAGKNEFYVELGNFIVPFEPGGNSYGWRDLFVLGGTAQSYLYGPNDSKYKSNFFGSTGINVSYLWGSTPNKPLRNQLAFISLDFLDGTYAQLDPNTYRVHTPLTLQECRALINSLDQHCDNKDTHGCECDYEPSYPGPTVQAKHGPVTNEMTYENWAACIQELIFAGMTEDHTGFAPWLYKSTNGLYELPRDMKTFLARLKNVVFDPTFVYEASGSDFGGIADVGAFATANSPIPGTPIAATWAPYVYTLFFRTTGVGHPGEYSGDYAPSQFRTYRSEERSGLGRLDWIPPSRPDGRYNVFGLPSGTNIPGLGDMTGRSIDVDVMNYMAEAFWLASTTFQSGPYAGAPDYYGVPFAQHTASPDYFFRTVIAGLPPTPRDKNVVPGDWLYGVMRDDKARSILGLSANAPVDRVGYITYYTTDFDSKGDSTLLPFKNVDPGQEAAIVAAARILQYFNSKGVKHIICDVRHTVGGGSPFWPAFAALTGGKRYGAMYKGLGTGAIVPVSSIEPNGITAMTTPLNIQRYKEISGEVVYDGRLRDSEVNPQAFVDFGLTDVVGSSPSPLWNGEITGQAAKGLTSNIIWISSETAISAPQADYMYMKSVSMDGSAFDGDYGKSTRFVGYGVYDRPFSTSGNYDCSVNWWTRGRAGQEENPNALIFGMSRWEASRVGYVDGAVEGEGGILKAVDQDFENLHRPQIKWDFNANVYFEDIGFTIGNPGLLPSDPETLIPPRYPGVNFNNPLTWRDSALERIVQMANDPNLISHFYQDDGYGYVSRLPQ